jgi:hypothetical protein
MLDKIKAPDVFAAPRYDATHAFTSPEKPLYFWEYAHARLLPAGIRARKPSLHRKKP